MDENVDDSSVADGLKPPGGPSNREDEIGSLPNAVVSPSHSPRSLRRTTRRATFDTIAPARGSTKTIKTTNKFVAAKVGRIHPGNASQFFQRTGATPSEFSFKWTGAESGLSKQRRGMTQRFKRPPFEQSGFYTPPVSISNPVVTKKLIKIAQEFNFLDHFFADCFRACKEASDHIKIQECLSDIRNDLAKCQRQSSSKDNSQAVHIGSLGEYCENVCTSWTVPASVQKMMGITIKGYGNDLKYGEDYLIYLQGTLEIPYWQLVIDLLLDWRKKTSHTFGTTILYMLQYKALSCRKKVEGLAQPAVPKEDEQGLIIVRRSIQERLDVINRALQVAMLDEDLDFKPSAIPGISGLHPEQQSGTCTACLPEKHDASMQLAFFVLFMILAFIPGYQGFAISVKTYETGTTSDADFYYLMQSSIMSVLGNFATALPLLQSGRISGPSHFFWVFSALGFFSAVLSVVIYPLTNTGWSSVVSFVGNVASAASVLVLTIATASERMIGPISGRHGNRITIDNADLDEKKNQ